MITRRRNSPRCSPNVMLSGDGRLLRFAVNGRVTTVGPSVQGRVAGGDPLRSRLRATGRRARRDGRRIQKGVRRGLVGCGAVRRDGSLGPVRSKRGLEGTVRLLVRLLLVRLLPVRHGGQVVEEGRW